MEDIELCILLQFQGNPVRGYEIILGVDWMRMYNPVVFYFAERKVS